MTTAFLGMGLLGSNFVRALRRNGEDVRVWNRSHDKASELAGIGAQVCADPAEAVRTASRVHLTLSDDQAVDEVLERASPGLGPQVVIIDHSTTSTAGAAARVARFRAQGMSFLHAPVFMGPQNARESTGVMLASGDAALVEGLRPALEKMTGELWYIDARPESAAAFKLLGNLFLIFMNAGLADLLALAKATQIAPADALRLFEHFNPGKTVDVRMQRMIDAQFSTPSWELGMARKDARLMLEEAAHASVPLSVLPSIAARMDQLISQGHAHDDWTVLAKDAVVAH